jgi:hypothetical protein
MTEPQWVLHAGEWVLTTADISHAVGDARKRLLEQANHDEQHAHADVDWTGPNVVLGED